MDTTSTQIKNWIHRERFGVKSLGWTSSGKKHLNASTPWVWLGAFLKLSRNTILNNKNFNNIWRSLTPRRNIRPLWLRDSKKGIRSGLTQRTTGQWTQLFVWMLSCLFNECVQILFKKGTFYGSVLDFIGPIPSGWRDVLLPPGNSLLLNGIVLFYNEWLTLIMGVARRSRILAYHGGEKVDGIDTRLIIGQNSWTKPLYNSATRVTAVH